MRKDIATFIVILLTLTVLGTSVQAGHDPYPSTSSCANANHTQPSEDHILVHEGEILAQSFTTTSKCETWLRTLYFMTSAPTWEGEAIPADDQATKFRIYLLAHSSKPGAQDSPHLDDAVFMSEFDHAGWVDRTQLFAKPFDSHQSHFGSPAVQRATWYTLVLTPLDGTVVIGGYHDHFQQGQYGFQGDAWVNGVHQPGLDAYHGLTSTATQPPTLPFAPINAPPTLTASPESIDVVEGTTKELDLSNLQVRDEDNDDVTLSVETTLGTFSIAAGITRSGEGTATATLTGSTMALETYLATTSNVQLTVARGTVGENVGTIWIEPSDGKAGTSVSIEINVLPDTDEDLIADRDDSCPTVKPVQDTNTDGCEDDTDADGIPDKDDACPTVKPTTDANKDGCEDKRRRSSGSSSAPVPKPDTDGDGISDEDEIAAGLDPESNDSDKDGIPDSEEELGQAIDRFSNEWRAEDIRAEDVEDLPETGQAELLKQLREILDSPEGSLEELVKQAEDEGYKAVSWTARDDGRIGGYKVYRHSEPTLVGTIYAEDLVTYMENGTLRILFLDSDFPGGDHHYSVVPFITGYEPEEYDAEAARESNYVLQDESFDEATAPEAKAGFPWWILLLIAGVLGVAYWKREDIEKLLKK